MMISWMAFCVNRFFEIFFGHALSGVRVQKVQKVQRVQRGRLTGLRPEGYVEGLCSLPLRGAGRKVLRIDRPAAGGFLSLTAFQAEGCGIALRAMSIKSAL